MAFGIWTTGRDEAAFELLKTIYNATKDRTIKGCVSYIFCNRIEGEGYWSDLLIRWARERGLSITTISSSTFEPELKKKDFEEWRVRFHRKAREALVAFPEDIRVLVGYMLILDPESCTDKAAINLHPARPGGPKGTWQEVIWRLIEMEADVSGVMIHLVTPELDAGPPISYCTFRIKGGVLDAMWKEFREKIKDRSLHHIIKAEGENNPLFRNIRRHGLKREFPLLIHTLRKLAEGEIRIEDGKVIDREGRILHEGYDLTVAVDKDIRDE